MSVSAFEYNLTVFLQPSSELINPGVRNEKTGIQSDNKIYGKVIKMKISHWLRQITIIAKVVLKQILRERDISLNMDSFFFFNRTINLTHQSG